MRLTWSFPADLLPHEFAQRRHEGRDTSTFELRWVSAGGPPEADVNGARIPAADDGIQRLARDIIEEMDSIWPVAPERLELREATWSSPVVLSADDRFADRVEGAWVGRAAGCLLGKPVEKVSRPGIRAILESQGRWPLTDFFTNENLPSDIAAKWPWNKKSATNSLVENIAGMPEDDDLNYPLLALWLLENKGFDFTTEDVAEAWLSMLPVGRTFTAERIAMRNLLLGVLPPRTAVTGNPFREWIGAQIRTDVYGWVNPGQPHAAARLAFADAALSHVGDGVSSALWVAAMTSAAVTAHSLDEVLEAGLSVVPDSRLRDAIDLGRQLGVSDLEDEAAIDRIYKEYGDLHWVHSVNNSALVAFALTRGASDFERSITLTVMGGWDTDSNGATVGSVVGGMVGKSSLPARWISPLRDRLASSVPGFDGVSFTDLAHRTVALARR